MKSGDWEWLGTEKWQKIRWCVCHLWTMFDDYVELISIFQYPLMITWQIIYWWAIFHSHVQLPQGIPRYSTTKAATAPIPSYQGFLCRTLCESPVQGMWEAAHRKSCTRGCLKMTDTLWLFNIAMENGPFIDDFPIKTSIYSGFSMAMLNNQMVSLIKWQLSGGNDDQHWLDRKPFCEQWSVDSCCWCWWWLHSHIPPACMGQGFICLSKGAHVAVEVFNKQHLILKIQVQQDTLRQTKVIKSLCAEVI